MAGLLGKRRLASRRGLIILLLASLLFGAISITRAQEGEVGTNIAWIYNESSFSHVACDSYNFDALLTLGLFIFSTLQSLIMSPNNTSMLMFTSMMLPTALVLEMLRFIMVYHRSNKNLTACTYRYETLL